MLFRGIELVVLLQSVKTWIRIVQNHKYSYLSCVHHTRPEIPAGRLHCSPTRPGLAIGPS